MSYPSIVKTYRLRSFVKDLSGLVLDEATLPKPEELASDEVVVKVHAVSLNARDLQIASGTYPAPHLPPSGLVPVSDAAGEVVAVGSGVTDLRPATRVVTHMCAEWTHGEIGNAMQATALGGGKDGVLAEYVVLKRGNVLAIPDHMSFEQASTLPIAALTAYHCLFGFQQTLQPGQTVLIEGTGGVSLAALQLALVTGARPIVISSSDAKLKRCQELGVAQGDCINYRTIPDWTSAVRDLTNGQGVDHTIEIGGRDTMLKAILATKSYGAVWVVGYMDDYKSSPAEHAPMDTAKAILYSQAIVRGVMVGPYDLFQQLLNAHANAQARVDTGLATKNVLTPIVDKVFPFEQAKKAFETLASGHFFGKVVIKISS